MVFDIVNNLLLYVEPQQKVCQILRYHVVFLEIGFAILHLTSHVTIHQML